MSIKNIKSFLIFAAFLLSFSINTKANSFFKPLTDSILTIPKDIEKITFYPLNNPEQTWQFALITGGLIAVDRPTTEFVQNNLNNWFDWKWYEFDHLKYFSAEEEALLAGLAGFYASGLLFNDEKSQATVYLTLKAFTYSVLYDQLLLKSIFGRLRPDPTLGSSNFADYPYTKNPLDFGHLHTPTLLADGYGTSFASFHFTLFFSCAKVWQRMYDNYLIPYSLCALALLPDFASHHHWVSDMVAGALIGTMIGDAIADNYFGINKEKKLSLQPTIIPIIGFDYFGIQLSMAM